jgi:hypothetical protein
MADNWTFEQLKYIEWLATPRMIRTPPTVELLGEQLGVDRVTLWRYSKLPGFDDEVRKLVRASIGKKLPDLYGALIREAEAGSFQHLQMALEMAGEYVKKQHNVNDSNVNGDLILRFIEEEVVVDADA